MAKKMITVRLSPANARLVALNIDGWIDAGACDGGLEPDERAALHSAYDQILRGLGRKLTRPKAACDCENPEPKSGAALVSEECPIHGVLVGAPAVPNGHSQSRTTEGSFGAGQS